MNYVPKPTLIGRVQCYEDVRNYYESFPEIDFDIYGEEIGTRKRYTSNTATIFHMLALSIGPTIFIIPSAFNMVGYVPAIFGILVIATFYSYNIRSLLYSSNILCDLKGRTRISYVEIVKYAFEVSPFKNQYTVAAFLYSLMNILFVLAWAGELSFGVIFVCKNLKQIIDHNYTTNLDIRLIALILLIPCTLVTLMSNLKSSETSISASIIFVFSTIIMLWISYKNKPSQNIAVQSVKDLHNVPSFLSSIFFTLNLTGIVLPLKFDMENPRKFDQKYGTFTQAMLIITVINITFGFFGYAVYGESIKDTMTLNLPPNTFTNAVISVYCLAVFLTYPICYSVIFDIIWNCWIGNKSILSQNAVRVIINLVIFLVIILFPKLSLFVDICGLVCAIFDSIIIPAIVCILLSWSMEEHFISVILKSAFILVCGTLLFVFGMYKSITNILEGSEY